MKNLLMKIDMWFCNWNWTDDLADLLWRGKCSHCMVAVNPDFEDMEAVLDLAQYLRGEGPWTVSVKQYDFVESNEIQLIQVRGWGLFKWKPSIRTDFFGPSEVLTA